MSATQPIPRTQDEAERAAAALGMSIPDACLPGLLANLALLQSHAERLFGPGDSPCE